MLIFYNLAKSKKRNTNKLDNKVIIYSASAKLMFVGISKAIPTSLNSAYPTFLP